MINNYMCPRCGHDVDRKSSMLIHIDRKNKCNPTMFDIDLANIADCHFTTIQKRRFKLGIKRFDSVSDFWLNIDPFLESHTVSEISKESGIPKARIYQRKRHLGLGSCEESIDWESIDKEGLNLTVT